MTGRLSKLWRLSNTYTILSNMNLLFSKTIKHMTPSIFGIFIGIYCGSKWNNKFHICSWVHIYTVSIYVIDNPVYWGGGRCTIHSDRKMYGLCMIIVKTISGIYIVSANSEACDYHIKKSKYTTSLLHTVDILHVLIWFVMSIWLYEVGSIHVMAAITYPHHCVTLTNSEAYDYDMVNNIW